MTPRWRTRRTIVAGGSRFSPCEGKKKTSQEMRAWRATEQLLATNKSADFGRWEKVDYAV